MSLSATWDITFVKRYTEKLPLDFNPRQTFNLLLLRSKIYIEDLKKS